MRLEPAGNTQRTYPVVLYDEMQAASARAITWPRRLSLYQSTQERESPPGARSEAGELLLAVELLQ
jgi:hypothetical protein